MEKTNKLLEAALNYLSRNWSIIPINPSSKKPCLASWLEYQKRPSTIDEIKRWWTQWPWANIGLITGKISGVSVIDVDPRHNGTTKNLTETVKSQTGGGGWHYFYKYSSKTHSQNSLIEGIDLKSDGGYIILPPSVHKSGNQYIWITLPFVNELSEIPDWVAKLQSKNQRHENFTIDIIVGTKEGRRDSRLFGLAYTLLCFGTKSKTVLDALFWLNSTFKPPLEEKIVLAKFESAVNRLYRRRTNDR